MYLKREKGSPFGRSLPVKAIIGKVCFPTTTHGHLPSSNYKTFLPGDAGFSYLLSKASRSKYMQLYRNHTHFESIRRIRDYVHALIMQFAPALGGRGGGQSGEQIRKKNSRYKPDYDCVTLRERNNGVQECELDWVQNR